MLIRLNLLRIGVHAEVVAYVVLLAGWRPLIVTVLNEVVVLAYVLFDGLLFES